MDPVQAFMQAHALTPPAFSPTSRYFGIATAQRVEADGRTVAYVQRRFLPMPERFALVRTISVVAQDRLDNIADRHLGDAEQWWRIADANRAMQPEALVATIGATLRITSGDGTATSDEVS